MNVEILMVSVGARPPTPYFGGSWPVYVVSLAANVLQILDFSVTRITNTHTHIYIFHSVEQMAGGKKVLLRYMSNHWNKGECGFGESPNDEVLIGEGMLG